MDEDRERYTTEVLKCLDELEAVADEKKATMSSDLKAREDAVRLRLAGWRAMLRGKKGTQVLMALAGDDTEGAP